jgi:hypothetical protein
VEDDDILRALTQMSMILNSHTDLLARIIELLTPQEGPSHLEEVLESILARLANIESILEQRLPEPRPS